MIFPQRHFFLQGYSQKGTGGNVFMNGVKSEVLFKECVEKINLWIDQENSKLSGIKYMKELYFTSPRRSSLRTIRLEYGQVGKKFVLRTFEGNIIGRRISEGSPKEEVFDDEKELLKKVYETKKGLLEGRWIVKN